MYIRTKAKFVSEDNPEDYEPSNFVFNLEDVLDYNQSDNGYTTVTLDSSTLRMIIAVKFTNFDKLFQEFHNNVKFTKIVE